MCLVEGREGHTQQKPDSAKRQPGKRDGSGWWSNKSCVLLSQCSELKVHSEEANMDPVGQ